MLYPERPRALDVDRSETPETAREFKSTYPGGGSYASFLFQAGYARAMMQAALSL